MTEDIDARLITLFAEFDFPGDPKFVGRVITLAAYDLKVRHARHAAFGRIAREGLALSAVLVCFFLLTLQAPGQPAGAGDALPWNSPATFGVTLLALWALIASQNRVAA